MGAGSITEGCRDSLWTTYEDSKVERAIVGRLKLRVVSELEFGGAP
jgi:hypothetical protein